MAGKKLRIDVKREQTSYEIVIGHDQLAVCGNWARGRLGKQAAKIVIVSNPTVFGLYGEIVVESLTASGFSVSQFLMKDGEVHKSMRSAESALARLAESGLSRTDAVVALGGGVVGDLAGFASAVYLRGIRFLQFPTTLLSMIDSSVGGKTGVNTAFGKNLVGAFHQPKGVLVDTKTLSTLPLREVKAGFCEAIKQGAIGGKRMLALTGEFLADHGPESFTELSENKRARTGVSDLIASNIAFKAAIVAGDEHEASGRMDARSRKILNFGHTLAHALEKVTDYKYFRHGEAVGYGILFAAELSKYLALCAENDVRLLNDVVHRVGPLPSLAGIDTKLVFEAFRFDKKQLAGSLQMVLLKGIGRPVILTTREIPPGAIQKVLKTFLQKRA